jgi:hypothetical protein
MPHWPVAGENAPNKPPSIERLLSVISLRKMEKIRRQGVNTRENGSTRRSVSLDQPSLVHAQSIVLRRSFPSCSFWVLEVSQKCSQLIHMRFAAAFASGLETRKSVVKSTRKKCK